MQIGRRIYYELATGNVILDTGERQGSVIETSQEQDFNTYLALSERVPSTVGMIQLVFGDRKTEFQACSGYNINPSTLEIIFDYTPPATPPPTVSTSDRLNALESALLEMMLS